MSGLDVVTAADLKRLEGKVDDLFDAVKALILIEERQRTQGGLIDVLSRRLELAEIAQRTLEKRFDRWLNLILGGVAVVTITFNVLRSFHVGPL